MTETPATPQYDLFVSYAPSDYDWVVGYLLDALSAAGVSTISEDDFDLGAPRIAQFEAAIRHSVRTLLVLSPAYLSETTFNFVNILAQYYGLESSTWPVVPLLLEPVQLPPRLAILVPLDATSPEQRDVAIVRLCTELEKPLPGPVARPPCPYPGMRAFLEQESAYFHGRSREVESLLQSLRRHPFITVIGASGSGKSSLVFAGLLPAMRASSLFGSGQWLVRAMRPGSAPLTELTNVLGTDQISAQSIGILLAAQPDATRLLLIVDQFEEMFSQETEEATAYTEQLARLLTIDGCFMVLTVRADFYADVMDCTLWNQIQAHRLEINPLSEAGLREAIEKPAEDEGVFIESALVEKLVAGSLRQPGVLPFVQEILVRLWEKLERRFLPLRAYDALVLSYTKYSGEEHSGLQAAMAQLADDLIALLSHDQKWYAQRTFLRLVQFGEGRADTRRQQPLAELRADGDDKTLFDQTIKFLADNRMLTLSGEEGGEPRVDISHEAMLTGWPLLHSWIETRRSSERMRRQLEAKAKEYDRLRTEGGGLLDNIELAEAQKWLVSSDAAELGVSDTLRRLIDDSQADAARLQAQRTRERRFRMLAFAVGGLLLFSIVLVYAILQTRLVEQQEQSLKDIATKNLEVERALEAERDARAETNRQLIISQSRQVAAVARNRLIGGDAELALLLAISADYVITDTVEARDVALDALLDWRDRQVVSAHRERIGGLRFSPDGRWVATYSDDDTVQIRALTTGRVANDALVKLEHKEDVSGIVFSDDGSRAATASRDDTAVIWNVATGAPIHTLEHDGDVRSIIVNLDRTLLATRSENEVRVWEFATGRPVVSEPMTAEGPIRAFTFSPDSSHILAGSDDVTAYLWNIETGGKARLPGFETAVVHVAWSPNGRYIAASDEKVLNLWDTRGGLQPVPPLPQSRGSVTFKEIAFSPDSRLLVAVGGDGVLRIWRLANLEQDPQVFLEHHAGITGLAFSPDDQWMATTDLNGVVWLWRMDTLTPETMLSTGAGDAAAPQFSPDSTLLAATDEGGRFYLWGVQSDAALAQIQMDAKPFKALAVSGNQLLYGGVDGVVGYWNWADGETGRFSAGRNVVTALATSPDGKWLVAGDVTGRIWLMKADDGTLIRSWQAHPNEVRVLRFLPHDAGLVSAGAEPTIRIWSYADGDLIRTLRGHGNDVNDIAFDQDGLRLYSASHDGTIRRWRWQTGEEEASYQLQAPVQAVAVSQDGKWVAGAGEGANVLVWPVEESTAPVVLPHTATAQTLLFAPDGRLVSGDNAGVLHVWSIKDRTETDFQAHGVTFRINDLALSGDGRILFSVGDDGAIRAWALRTESILYHACVHLPRSLSYGEWRDYMAFTSKQDACHEILEQRASRAIDLAPPRMEPVYTDDMRRPTIFYLESISGTRVTNGTPVRLRWSTSNAEGGVFLEINGKRQGVVSPGESEYRVDGRTVFRLIAMNPSGLGRTWQLVVHSVDP